MPTKNTGFPLGPVVTIQVCPACFRDSVETIFVKQSRSTVRLSSQLTPEDRRRHLPSSGEEQEISKDRSFETWIRKPRVTMEERKEIDVFRVP